MFVIYKVKVNKVRVDTVIDLNINCHTKIARQALSDLLKYSIAQIGWLNRPEKRYGTMMVQFTQKTDANKVLARGLIKIRRRSACKMGWIEKSRAY